MRRALIIGVLFGVAAPSASAAPGDLDESFSRDGKLVERTAGEPTAIAVEPDGGLLIANDYGTFYPRHRLMRIRADGQRGQSFGDDGVVALDQPASDVMVQDGGRILTASHGSSGQTEVTGLLLDGRIDPSFGTAGIAPVGPPAISQPALLPVSERRILVVGRTYADGSEGVVVARLLANGQPDPSFSSDGVASFFGSDLTLGISEALVAPDDSVTLVGTIRRPEEQSVDVRLVRIDAQGNLDAAFGTGGVATTDFGWDEAIFGAARQPGGTVMASMGRCTRVGCDPYLLRFARDGTLDTTFGRAGIVATMLLGPMVTAPGGGADVAGGRSETLAGPTGADFLLGRVGPSGTPDQDFGRGGIVTTDFDFSRYDRANLVATTADGRIVLAGSTEHPTYRYADAMAIARYEVVRGPADADADGRRDRVDRCPKRFAMDRSGCPRVKRRLRAFYLQRDRGVIAYGRLTLPGLAHIRRSYTNQRIRLRIRRPGRDPVVRRLRTDENGHWSGYAPNPSRRLYAEAAGTVVPALGRCVTVRRSVHKPD